MYSGKCLGRVLYFLRKYITSWDADICTIDSSTVRLDDKLIATYEWVAGDLPEFNFSSEYQYAVRAQNLNMISALTSCWGYTWSHSTFQKTHETSLGVVYNRVPFSNRLDEYKLCFSIKGQIISAQANDEVRVISIFKDESELSNCEIEAINRSRQFMRALLLFNS